MWKLRHRVKFCFVLALHRKRYGMMAHTSAASLSQIKAAAHKLMPAKGP
jgi:hypothetical protein